MQFYLARNKRPSEKVKIGIDFTSDLNPGDSVVSHSVTAFDQSGADATTAFTETPLLFQNVSTVIIKGGTEGAKYRVFFQGTTAEGEILQHSIAVLVKLNS